MAAAAAVLLILLLLSVFSTITTTAQQTRNSNISIGSSLAPTTNTNNSWLSPSGLFAFGFYKQEGSYVVGIWFAGIPQKTIVWTANPKVSSNVTLVLTRDRGLVLQSSQGQNNVISDILEPSVSYASMLDTGNMVLYDTNSKIIWQSFDSPTDTILQSQRLQNNKQLISRVSETNYSQGRFRLLMQIDGYLVQYPKEAPNAIAYAYWSSNTTGGNKVTTNLDDDGHLYVFDGASSLNLKSLSTASVGRNPNQTIFYRMTLDVDGIFRVYSHNMDQNGSWSIKWISSNDKCSPKGICGNNGYCTILNQEIKCNCLPGFNFTDSSQPIPGLGCRKDAIVELCGRQENQTKNSTMYTLEDTTWVADQPYFVLPSTTEEKCKDACLEDCNCEAVMFQNQNCTKQKLPLKYGRTDPSNSFPVFVKVITTKTGTTTETTNQGSKETKKKKDLCLGILIASASLAICAFVFLGVSGFLIYRHRTSPRYKILEQRNIGLNEGISLRSFTYGELEKATDSFKEVLGQGSFGTVFKGALSNGTKLIAVKRLEKVVNEGEREFQAEMRTIGRTHHRNLVQLLGYCHEGINRLLVYEYMSNGSLADFLFKSEERPGWDERVQISMNIASGILYLHEECDTQIIHCDIKPQNILMDEFRIAKIADFGLAKLLKQDQTRTYTGIRGTRGYVAPEWHRNLPVTVKADVYSFGIVLLEIICCRRSLDVELQEDEIILVDWVFQCFDTGELGKLVSDDIKVDMRNFERMIRVALWCIQDEPSMRPSMKKVVLMLEGTIDIPIPPSPNSFLPFS